MNQESTGWLKHQSWKYDMQVATSIILPQETATTTTAFNSSGTSGCTLQILVVLQGKFPWCSLIFPMQTPEAATDSTGRCSRFQCYPTTTCQFEVLQEWVHGSLFASWTSGAFNHPKLFNEQKVKSNILCWGFWDLQVSNKSLLKP